MGRPWDVSSGLIYWSILIVSEIKNVLLDFCKPFPFMLCSYGEFLEDPATRAERHLLSKYHAHSYLPGFVVSFREEWLVLSQYSKGFPVLVPMGVLWNELNWVLSCLLLLRIRWPQATSFDICEALSHNISISRMRHRIFCAQALHGYKSSKLLLLRCAQAYSVSRRDTTKSARKFLGVGSEIVLAFYQNSCISQDLSVFQDLSCCFWLCVSQHCCEQAAPKTYLPLWLSLKASNHHAVCLWLIYHAQLWLATD